MSTTLIRDIDLLVADVDEEPLQGASLLIEGATVRSIGADVASDIQPDRTIDGRGHLFMPGLINTHHHFFQSLTRNLPKTQDAKLFDWIVENFKIWRNLDHEMAASAGRTIAVELLLSGCTTAVDHCYIHPRRSPEIASHEIRAVREVGLRFHLARGALSPGFDLDPEIVQDDDAVQIYEWFLNERPNHRRVPSWMESIIIAKKKDVNNLEETEAAMNADRVRRRLSTILLPTWGLLAAHGRGGHARSGHHPPCQWPLTQPNLVLSRQGFRRPQLFRPNLRSVYQGLRHRRPKRPEGAVGENPLSFIDP